ncbi:cytochrome c [Massilia sp. TN1-12]|uniref:cytochrome c n=1 Tax=Massilia paldalensis TaxID=3377675 RepID=UPI00384C59B5
MQLRTLIGGAAVAAIAAAAVLGGLYAWTRAAPIAPADAAPPPPSAAVLAAGARVVALGDCMVCHTAGDGPAYAGGLGLRTPFGTIYSTNITPDPETGIGRWTLPAFRRALREGTSRDGHLLYPAFPYIHYTRMSDNDIELAYRYLMTRTPVHAPAPANDLLFPLNFRPVLAFWNMLYLRPGTSDTPASQATPIERGRYLVDTLGHCASCHSGLNLMGGERSPAFQGGRIDGWNAPALTRLAAADAPWTQADLVEYLRGGLALGHGAAKGPMRPVTERLASVPREDVEAIAAYLMSIQVAPQSQPAAAPAVKPAAAIVPGDRAGETLFAAACAGCHAAPAPMMRLADRPGLARSSAVLSGDPANFVQTVLQGIPWDNTSTVYMPPFADTLDDKQVAQLAAYVRTGLAARPAWDDVAATSAKLRKENQP